MIRDGTCMSVDGSLRDDKDTEKVVYHGILVIGFLFAISALCGNVYIFLNQRQIQSDMSLLRQQFKDSRSSVSQQGVNPNNNNLLTLLFNQTQNLFRKIDRLQLWANKSACLEGSGIVSG